MTEQPHRCNEHEAGKTLADGEGQGDLEGCSPWGYKELDTTEQLNNRNNKSPIKRMNTGFGVQSPSSSSKNQDTPGRSCPPEDLHILVSKTQIILSFQGTGKNK